jgi:DNA-binding MarR family transcriptional regulator
MTSLCRYTEEVSNKLQHKINRSKRSARGAPAPDSRKESVEEDVLEFPTDPGSGSVALGDLANNLGYRIRRAQLWSFRDVSRKLAPFALGPVQFSVLSIIDANPGINQLTIASALSIERAGLGRLVDRLEQQGLVVRTASSANRRYYVLGLTTAGERLLKQVRPIVAQCESTIADKLGAQTYDELLRALSVFLED